MTESTLKERLITTLEAARIREDALLAFCDDEPSAVEGQWTAKDNVAHLNTWRDHAAQTLDSVRLAQPMAELPDSGDLDARNAVIYEEHRGDSAADVRASADRTYAALIDAIAACSEEDLLRERPGAGGPVWRIVPGNGHAHVSQHLSYWYAEHGDPAAAEASAVWAHALEFDLFPDAVERAAADYNLGCFYARNARAAEALPLLAAALHARPDLRTWAAEDPDLDPVRDDPEVRTLLAG